MLGSRRRRVGALLFALLAMYILAIVIQRARSPRSRLPTWLDAPLRVQYRFQADVDQVGSWTGLRQLVKERIAIATAYYFCTGAFSTMRSCTPQVSTPNRYRTFSPFLGLWFYANTRAKERLTALNFDDAMARMSAALAASNGLHNGPAEEIKLEIEEKLQTVEKEAIPEAIEQEIKVASRKFLATMEEGRDIFRNWVCQAQEACAKGFSDDSYCHNSLAENANLEYDPLFQDYELG